MSTHEYNLKILESELETIKNSDDSRIESLFYKFILLGDRDGVLKCIKLDPRKIHFPMYTESKPTLVFMNKFYSLIPETDPLDIVRCVNHNSVCIEAVLQHPKWESSQNELYNIIDTEISSSQNGLKDNKLSIENILRTIRFVWNLNKFISSHRVSYKGTDCDKLRTRIINIELSRRLYLGFMISFLKSSGFNIHLTPIILFRYEMEWSIVTFIQSLLHQ